MASVAELADWLAWAFMWAFAISIYGTCKWLTLCDALNDCAPKFERALAYLFLWPGMGAKSFVKPARRAQRPGSIEWCAAIGKAAIVFGGTFVLSWALAHAASGLSLGTFFPQADRGAVLNLGRKQPIVVKRDDPP